MSTVYRLPPRPVHATVQRNRAVDGLRKEFTHLTNVSSTGARVIYVTGLPGTGKKTVCYQYAEEFMSVKDGKQRIVSTWNLETPESLFRSLCDLAVMMGAPHKTETVIRRKYQLMSKRIKAAKRIYESKKSGYKLLLILTNVGQQMKNLRQYWPQHGDEQWEDTQVLLCVDDVSDLGISNAEINELSLNKGLVEDQALALLNNLSGKKDDEDDAKYLLKELNYHPMSIAHTAIFLKSVLQNPDNAGFGWKDCLIRIEKLKMSTVGQYNTKQSLALTTILENNHAVSEMAINRLGSINPYIEAAFTFIAFCDKDDIFSIPIDVISNFVMEDLRTEDDVDNTKIENNVKATIKSCPLFLIPKSIINLKTVEAKDNMPRDTEGLFKSQLPPSKTDILPQIGDGCMTGVTRKSPTPNANDKSKETIIMATKPTSRPGTQEKPGSRPTTQEKPGSRPTTQEKLGSRPSTQEKPQSLSIHQEKPESRPATQEKAKTPAAKTPAAKTPAATQEKPASRPATQEKPESRPATQEKAKTPAAKTPAAKTPAAQTPAAKTPAATQEKPASRPATQEKAKTPAAQTPKAQTPAAKTPAATQEKPESRPATQEKAKTPAAQTPKAQTPAAKTPAATQEKPESRPATQEKAKTPAAQTPKAQTPAAKTPAATQEKPESRPATQEKAKTPAAQTPKAQTPAAKTPAATQEKPESRPATQEKAKTPAAQTPKAQTPAAKTPAATQEKPESRPATQEKAKTPAAQTPKAQTPAAKTPAATQEKPESRPATQEKAKTPAAQTPKAQTPAAKTPAATQEKAASRPATQEKPGSRPATQEKAASRPGTQGKDGVEVKTAPPTPEPGKREEIKTSEIDDDKPPKVESGKLKPVNAEPPVVEAGVFKPLMAEPPRPKTPAEKAKEAPQMSGTIEKPAIDGRISAADRLVEANLYGNELVTGEVPIMKREGSVVINVEDTLRAFEDEVEAVTFNNSVHGAMRKFARNIVLRRVKGGQGSSSAADTVAQQRKLQLEQFIKATKVLLLTYEKVYESKEPTDLAMKRMLGPQLQYFVNCMLTKFNFKNRVAVRALKFYADSLMLLGELVKAEEALETAQNIAFQCFHPTDLDLFDILRDRASTLAKLGQKEETAGVLEQCITIIEQLEGEDMLMKECELLNELAQVHGNIGNLSYANKLLERSLSIKESLHGSSALEICDTLSRVAMLRNKMGEPNQAHSQLQRVMRIQEKHDIPRHEFSSTLCNMAAVNAALGEHEKSKVLYQSVLASQEKMYGQWYPEIATTLSNLAMVHMALGEYEEAKDSLQRTQKIRSRVYGKNHPLVASTLTNLASVVYTMGDMKTAMKLNEQAFEIQKAVYPDAHPLVAVTLKNMAMIENSTGNLDKAKALYERVLQIEELVYGELHPAVASTLNNLADTVLEQGETAKAAVLFQRAMETNEIVFGKDHPDIARNLNNLGRAFKEMGDYDGAKSKLTLSLQMKEKRYGDVHINLVPTLMNLGDLFNLTKQPQRAKDVLTRGLKISEKKIGMKHPDSAKLLRLLGNSFYLMGDLATSEKLLNKSLDILEDVYDSNHPYVLATRADLGACSRPVGTRVF